MHCPFCSTQFQPPSNQLEIVCPGCGGSFRPGKPKNVVEAWRAEEISAAPSNASASLQHSQSKGTSIALWLFGSFLVVASIGCVLFFASAAFYLLRSPDSTYSEIYTVDQIDTVVDRQAADAVPSYPQVTDELPSPSKDVASDTNEPAEAKPAQLIAFDSQLMSHYVFSCDIFLKEKLFLLKGNSKLIPKNDLEYKQGGASARVFDRETVAHLSEKVPGGGWITRASVDSKSRVYEVAGQGVFVEGDRKLMPFLWNLYANTGLEQLPANDSSTTTTGEFDLVRVKNHPLPLIGLFGKLLPCLPSSSKWTKGDLEILKISHSTKLTFVKEDANSIHYSQEVTVTSEKMNEQVLPEIKVHGSGICIFDKQRKVVVTSTLKGLSVVREGEKMDEVSFDYHLNYRSHEEQLAFDEQVRKAIRENSSKNGNESKTNDVTTSPEVPEPESDSKLPYFRTSPTSTRNLSPGGLAMPEGIHFAKPGDQAFIVVVHTDHTVSTFDWKTLEKVDHSTDGNIGIKPCKSACSPSGDRLAVAYENGSVLTYQISEDGKLTRIGQYERFKYRISCLRFADDSRQLFTGDRSNRLIFWNVDTQKESFEIKSTVAPLDAQFAAADSKLNVIQVARFVSYEHPSHRIDNEFASRSFTSGTISPDRKKLVAFRATAKEVVIFDLVEFEVIKRLKVDVVAAIFGFSPDSKQVYWQDGRIVSLYDFDEQKRYVANFEEAPIQLGVCFSPEGKEMAIYDAFTHQVFFYER